MRTATYRVRRITLRAVRLARIGFRAARILATTKELPWLLRVLFVIGLVQVPVLPFDEVAMAIALAWLGLFHRSTLRAAFATAASTL
jgi:hypothetical protein